ANAAREIPPNYREDWDRAVSKWLERYSAIIDSRGEMLSYEVSTPWGKYENQFKTFLKDDSAVDKARRAAGLYRGWKIDGKPFQMDDPDQHLTIGADAGFSLEAVAPPAKVDQLPPLEGWTIISLLNHRNL